MKVCVNQIREVLIKQRREKCVLRANQEGGQIPSPQKYFLSNHIGPSKHVLHLVWSALVISTAYKTALKVALSGLLNPSLKCLL